MMARPMKYKDLTRYSATIGAVTINGIPVQLCDYVENIEDIWCATAYLSRSGPHDHKILSDMGVVLKTLPTHDDSMGLCLAYVPLKILDKAIPQYDDEQQTENLVMRLQKELRKLNMAALQSVVKA